MDGEDDDIVRNDNGSHKFQPILNFVDLNSGTKPKNPSNLSNPVVVF